jgi:hypothetical protein
LALALALPSVPVSAQSATSAPIYYKGKGPGGNNSYFFRYEEDYSFLRDPSKSTDFFDPVKFIAFDDAKQIYVTFSALERLRYDNIQNQNFGLGSQVQGHQTEAYSRRTQVGADVHLGPNFRIFAELINGAASGRNVTGAGKVGNGGTSPTGPQWRNDLALQQAFIEAMTDVDLFGTPGKIGIRAGRQGVYFGNGLVVAPPSTPATYSMPDGIRAYADTGHDRLDLFFGVPTIRRNDGLLRDSDDQHEQYGFLYGSHDFPTINLMGFDAHLSDDPFATFTRSASSGSVNPAVPGGVSASQSFRTITTTYGNQATAINTITGQEEVWGIGNRFYGDIGNFDFDWTGVLQRGSIGGYSVEAFAIFTDWGYTLRDLPWKPRVGTTADVGSGGGDKKSKTTHLYDAQFMRQPYIGTVVVNSPSITNEYHLAPRVRISPTPTISAEFVWNFYWRYSSADGIYSTGGYQTPSSFGGAATVGKPGTYVGSLPTLALRWTPIAHVAVDSEIGQLVAGPVIKNAGGQNNTYVNVQVTLQF